jgi:2-polyprenyl-6-methoxyphenol hydroxylase-like FAD-dependent oxidoreductase
VIAADGRFSKLRRLAGFTAEGLSPPMDVAWLRLPREASDEVDTGAFYIAHGRICVLLTRPKEWQLGYVFPKGDFNEIKKQGIEAFRNDIASIVPWLGNRVENIKDFSEVHLLTVKSDRLEKWYRDGLLFIGDAAHAMSPVGGVGINYAISDAVEAANVLTAPLLADEISEKHLASVQQRRMKPTRSIQRLQSLMQKYIVSRALKDQEFDLPLIAKIILKIPLLRDIPGRTMALGISRVRLE